MMTAPVSDKRSRVSSTPAFSTSTTNGVEFAAPYYWNIAPEYDLNLLHLIICLTVVYSPRPEFCYLGMSSESSHFWNI